MPLALLLGLKREAIGTAVSIVREPTLGIIKNLYGPDSPEGARVLGTYLTGTLLVHCFLDLRRPCTDHRTAFPDPCNDLWEGEW